MIQNILTLVPIKGMLLCQFFMIETGFDKQQSELFSKILNNDKQNKNVKYFPR